ncbi:MAG: hypothetical protein HGA61_02605 [Candidatus Moranbacteria bacterium]|nr:hypothetical protein [Candidatus Moranbacteria bacterium]
MIRHDYIIESEIDCDPSAEKCFVYLCDPGTEQCTGIEEEDIFYYKIARRRASNIPLCDPVLEGCDQFLCSEGEKDCEIRFCDQQVAAEKGEECNDPEQYLIDNPIEEDLEGCDPQEEADCVLEEAQEESDSAEKQESPEESENVVLEELK